MTFSTVLTGAAEQPSVATTGNGQAKVVIDTDLLTMRVIASFSDLIGNVTAAHIHCCTAGAGTGSAGVATPAPTFPGFPSGVTAGAYDHTFDMSLTASYNAAFIAAQGGTAGAAFAALLAGMQSERTYFNVHTIFAPAGEIRGYLAPVSAVPLPAALPLLAAGLGTMAVFGRRRKRRSPAG